MFTIKDIKAAHSKVRSGADFPAYVHELIKMGVTAYDTFVSDGHAVYKGNETWPISSDAAYDVLTVADKSNTNSFKKYLVKHQQGQTDYPTFRKHSAKTGVEKWKVDFEQMTCTYYDKQGTVMLEEKLLS